MQLGKFVLGASIALSAVASAQAGTVTSTWSDWAASAHPGYSAGVGALTPDAASEFPATLSIDNTGTLFGGPLDEFYYTGMADADFVLNSALQGGGVSNITLSIIAAGNSFTQEPTLTLGGQSYAFDTQTVVDAGDVGGFAAQFFTFNWDLSNLGSGSFADGSLYQIAWGYAAHVAFAEIGTTQTTGVNAVPEPATYAMMLVGLAGVGTVARRRRAQ